MPNDSIPFKVVAVDMDGTLLRPDHNVSDETKEVLRLLLERGVHIIFATGRPYTDIARIKKHLSIFDSSDKTPTSPDDTSFPRCFTISSNGSRIYDEWDTEIYRKDIPEDLCTLLFNLYKDDAEVNVNLFRTPDSNATFTPEECFLGVRPTDEWLSRYPCVEEAKIYNSTHFTYKVIEDFDNKCPKNNVSGLFYLCYNPQKSALIEEAVQKLDQDYCHAKQQAGENVEKMGVRTGPSSYHCIDIMRKDVSKASALEYVTERLGLTIRDCVAFGDALNDIEMLKSVGKGYVMGNANPRLKKLCPELETIGTNAEDGVTKKLRELFEL